MPASPLIDTGHTKRVEATGAASTPRPKRSIPPFNFKYLNPSQESLPHIVKFSGGRSSAAMTLLMARNGRGRHAAKNTTPQLYNSTSTKLLQSLHKATDA